MSVACFSSSLCSFLKYLLGTYCAPGPGLCIRAAAGHELARFLPGKGRWRESWLKNRANRKGIGGPSAVQRITAELGA